MRILYLVNLILKNQKRDVPYHYFEFWPEKITKFKVIDTFNIPFITKFEKYKLRFYILQGIVAFFYQFNFDVVISDSSQSGLFLAFLRSLFGIKKPPLVIIDVESFGRKTSKTILRFIRFACESVDAVIYQSSIQKEYYDKYLPNLKDKTFFIPLGVRWNLEDMNLRKDMTEEYIVSSGKQDRTMRDWDTLLEGFRPFSKRIKLKIVGKERLIKGKDISFNTEIPENLEFIPYTFGIEYSNIIYNAKFVILPLVERRQSIGQLTLLHAMALGKAVIVADVSGIKDYVIDGETAILYKPGNSKDLASKIEYLLDNPQEINRIGENTKNVVKEKFQFKKMVDEMYKVVKGKLK
jgi:glycosyltransferase involved in cell wall biosynthesis